MAFARSRAVVTGLTAAITAASTAAFSVGVADPTPVPTIGTAVGAAIGWSAEAPESTTLRPAPEDPASENTPLEATASAETAAAPVRSPVRVHVS